MKLLLTSVGLTNDSIRKALVELLGKPIEECRAVQISTALYASPSGPEDAYQMAKYYGEMGWKELGTLELTALPTIEEEHWLPFVESSDAILVSGGNTGYLSHWFQESGFAERLPGLLEERVYFGISAGSAMATPGQNYDPERLEREGVYYDDEYEEAAPRNAGSAWGMGLVGFAFRPHLNADYFPMANMQMMERRRSSTTRCTLSTTRRPSRWWTGRWKSFPRASGGCLTGNNSEEGNETGKAITKVNQYGARIGVSDVAGSETG